MVNQHLKLIIETFFEEDTSSTLTSLMVFLDSERSDECIDCTMMSHFLEQ